MLTRLFLQLIVILLAATSVALAQDLGSLTPRLLPPLTKPDDPATPAKQIFGRKPEPAAAHVAAKDSAVCQMPPPRARDRVTAAAHK
jgi:hypothetical protein